MILKQSTLENNTATYDKDRFIWEVTNEAVALRENATQAERGMLNLCTLSAVYTNRCIYGQMTGDCHSDRALELIEKCTPRYFEGGALTVYGSLEEAIANANGTKVQRFKQMRKERYEVHFSAIEIFISVAPDKKIESLVKYLRGDSNKLNVYF